MIQVCNRELAGKKLQDSLYEILDSIIHDQSAPSLLGTNMYNEILWFNKEQMENTLWFLLLAQAVFADKSPSMTVLATANLLLLQKQEQSEYKAQHFLDLLETPQHKKKRLAEAVLAQKPEKKATTARTKISTQTAGDTD